MRVDFYDEFSKVEIKDLLEQDSDGFFEEADDFVKMVQEFDKDQQFLFMSLVVISVFSSVFLLICVQFILNYQRLSD